MPSTENISLYPGKKEALASYAGGHIDREYNIVSDTTGEDGVRTIVLKKQDLTELQKLKRELVKEIAEQLGEGSSKVFKEILMDALKDYKHANIVAMHKEVCLEKKKPVKARPGCYKIIIGDGRRKNSHHIRIRE